MSASLLRRSGSHFKVLGVEVHGPRVLVREVHVSAAKGRVRASKFTTSLV